VRDHRGGRRLAVRPADGDHAPQARGLLQELRAVQDGLGRLHLGQVTRYRGGHDDLHGGKHM
jgi:hypothetical protein